MDDAKLLQLIRDKILNVTTNTSSDLDNAVYLQQIRDAILGVTVDNSKYGNLDEAIYLQQIRDAILGVPIDNSKYGSLDNAIYLQQIRDAYNGIAARVQGGMDDDIYLAEILSVATGGDTTAPTCAIALVSQSAGVAAMSITFSEAVVGFVAGDITISAGGSLANFATADNIVFTVDWTLAAGVNTMDVAAGVCTDLAGNANEAATQYGIGAEATLTLQSPGATVVDAYIEQAAPDTNISTGAILIVGEPNDAVDVFRVLIEFDLTSLPANALITSATLSLYATSDKSSNARTFRVYRVKRAWTITGATWNKYDASNSWQTAGAFGANDCEQTEIGSRAFTAAETLNVFKDFALTPTTKDALDLGNGFLVKADTESDDSYRFASTDNVTSANRPKLTIVYRVPL